MSEQKAKTRKLREPEPKICFLSMMNSEQFTCPRQDCVAWNTNPKYPGCLIMQALQTTSYNLVQMMKRMK